MTRYEHTSAALALVVACAAPKSTYPTATDDDLHPQPIAIDELGRGEARAKATDEGAWWFSVELAPLATPTGRITFTARDMDFGDSTVQLRVIEGAEQHDGPVDRRESRVVLAERAARRSLRLRVSTSGSAELVVTTSRDDDPLPVVPRPMCDLDNPDFSNPDCCEANCIFGDTCAAAVIDAGPATIAIGKSQHIMRGATGELMQGDRRVSKIVVRSLDVAESVIDILEWSQVDRRTLVENGHVVLYRPVECRER